MTQPNQAGNDGLGRIPDSPPRGDFTEREGYTNTSSGGTSTGGSTTGSTGAGSSYTPVVTPGSYESPPGTVSNVGYEVLVLAGPSYTQAIALIASHQGMTITREVSADGGGTINLNRDSPLFYTDPIAPTNLIPNPDFETAPSGDYGWGWQVNGRDTTGTIEYANYAGGDWLHSDGSNNRVLWVQASGAGYPKVNTLEGTAGIPVTPGTQVTATVQVKPNTIGRPTRLYVEFYDSNGVYMSVGRALRGDYMPTVYGAINYMRLDGTIPENAKYAAVGVEISAQGAPNELHRFDNFMFYATPEATPFYDGRDKSDLIDKENLWEVYYNGRRIHEFIGTVRSADLVNLTESRTVTVSGAGTAELMKRVRVLPPEWTIRNGKPWLVKPIKEMREDYGATTDGAINTKLWNKKLTMNVTYDESDPVNPNVQVMALNPSPAYERIGTGPWDMRYGAKLPGDASATINALYFRAFPFLLTKPAPTDDGDYFPGDFHNIWEIYVSDLDRVFIEVRSTLTSTGTLTHNLNGYIYTNGTGQSLGSMSYSNGGSQNFFRFRYHSNNYMYLECGSDGITFPTTIGSFPLNPSVNGIITDASSNFADQIDQVTFRAYSYFTGIPFAYQPPESRPVGGQGQAGYTFAAGTVLLPVNGEDETYNPAYMSFGKINDNGVVDVNSPVYDQMGYFRWKALNAQSSRGVLGNLTFDWTTGNFRTGYTQPGLDSIGDKRKGIQARYFKTKDADNVNSLFVTGPVDAKVPTGTEKQHADEYKYVDGTLHYPKYTYTDPITHHAEEALLVKVKVTQPTDGQTFYDYFVQSCTLAKCDWIVKPGRSVQIFDTDPDLTDNINYPDQRLTYFYKNNSVFFHEGYSTINKSMAKSSESIVNYVIGHDSNNNYELAKDDDSIAKWGVREAWVEVDYTDSTTVSLQTAVSTILAIGVNELESWTISVPVFDGIRPFVDYFEGDWISVAKHTGADPKSSDSQYDIFRVMAISLSVGLNGEETVELTLTSLVETRIKMLQDKLTNTNQTSQVATASVPPNSTYVAISSSPLSTLADVSVDGAEPGSYLRLNTTGVWVAQPAVSTPVAIDTSFISVPLGDGTTTAFTITHNLGTVAVDVRVIALVAGVGGIARGGANAAVGEDVTGSYQLRQNTDGSLSSPTTLIRTAIPIVADQNRVKVVFVTQAPFTAPAASSFRVVVLRGSATKTKLAP